MKTDQNKLKNYPAIGVASFLVIAIFAVILIVPTSREIFKTLSGTHPLIMGFVKFGFLATTGELIAARLTKKTWTLPHYFLLRMLIWALLGIVIALTFKLYSGGATFLLETGILPGKNNLFAHALAAAVLMNVTFGPVMMGFHRMSDKFLDLKYELKSKVSLQKVIDNMDWQTYIRFVVCKTIPIFWIPAHTITFMLPPEYQIIVAAFLSIALGIILSLKNNK